MPVATRMAETVRRELKSCPPDGFVVLRQLSYDEMLERRDGASQILMNQGVRTDGGAQMAVKILNKWSNAYTFPRCISDHNLTDSNDVPLDFSKPDLVFKHLDPKVGAEIESYIDELNQEAEGSEDFTLSSDSFLQTESPMPNNDSAPN
jgi:hypothetical protein